MHGCSQAPRLRLKGSHFTPNYDRLGNARRLAGNMEKKLPPTSRKFRFLWITLSSDRGLTLKRHSLILFSTSASDRQMGSLDPGMKSPRLFGSSSATNSMYSPNPRRLTNVQARCPAPNKAIPPRRRRYRPRYLLALLRCSEKPSENDSALLRSLSTFCRPIRRHTALSRCRRWAIATSEFSKA